MKYEDGIKTIAGGDITIAERSSRVVKMMAEFTAEIVDYNYAAEHYKGSGSVMEDCLNKLKNKMALVMSEMDIYAEQLGVTDKVVEKKKARINRILK